MRRVAALAAAAGVSLALAGCGALERTPVTVPTVTRPATTGPALDSRAFTERAQTACTRLFTSLDALGRPPTGDIADAREYYPEVAAAWHRALRDTATLRPPPDLSAAWDEVVEAYRSIAQNADENVLLAGTNREAIEIVNSDASARTQEALSFAAAKAQALGLAACAGGSG